MNLRQLVERGDRPFASHPQVGRYFPAASIEDARRRLTRAIERGEGPAVVIGAAGSGKSLLLQVLAAQHREKFDVVLLACAQLCTRRALLQAIHFELGLDYRRRDEGQLRLSLLDQLLSASEATEGLLLLVDEAQTLPVHLLDELRMLTNLARNVVPWVRLVLAGLPQLEEKLASPELESFSQRLSTRCYLAPLSRDETTQFIRAQLANSGVDPMQVFAAGAFDAVFNATDGVPRLVNQLCDRALLLAVAKQLPQVDASVVQSAWADLQQLPTPWETPTDTATATGTKTAGSVVEFGSLAEIQPVVKQESPPELAPRPASVAPPSLTINVGRLADRMASMPLLNAESDADEPEEPTELDEELLAAIPQRPAPGRRPRTFNQPAPDAVDPFADAFDEEELVLDSFAAISGLFGTRTPRVENRRDPAFARFVGQVLETTTASKSEPAGERDAGTAEPRDRRSDKRPRIRLAVISDAPPASHEVEPHVEKLVAQAEELDFGPPSRETAKSYRQVFSRLAERLDEESVSPSLQPAELGIEVAESLHETESAILVIEDDPTAESPAAAGVRRENYRQLFSRLRHGA